MGTGTSLMNVCFRLNHFHAPKEHSHLVSTKKNYFTISKTTLSFIPYHFIIQPTSQLLFYHSAHQNNINYTIKLYKIIYHSFLIYVSLSLFQPHLYTATTLLTAPPPHNNHHDPKPTTILANTNL